MLLGSSVREVGIKGYVMQMGNKKKENNMVRRVGRILSSSVLVGKHKAIRE